MRYHKAIGFRPQDIKRMEILNTVFQRKRFIWSNHAKKRLQRVENLEYFYNWLNMVEFMPQNIIEYTVQSNEIVKVLYRLQYDQKEDIILSIGNTGNLITLWFNDIADRHVTLNKRQYAKV